MKSGANHITISAILTGLALSLFTIELLIPPFPFCPSAKIGLANIVTLFMLTKSNFFRVGECFLVIIARCLLSAVITGRIMSVFFSLSGGIISLLIMLLFRRILGLYSIVAISVSGAVVHNITQMCVAVLIYGTYSAVYYLPALFLTGVASGVITGLCIIFINKNKFISSLFNSEVYSDGKRKN